MILRPQAVAIIVERRGLVAAIESTKRGGVEIPGGHIEPGETPVEAAVRELYEETGLRAHAVQHLLTMRAGPHLCAMYYAAVTDAQRLRSSPEGTALWVTRERLLAQGNFPEVYGAIFAAADATFLD